MPSYNKVILLGHLTRDPELRTTPKGQSVCQFGLAINHSYKDAAGHQREETTFVDIEAWGRPGEVIAQYCAKGRPLLVEGRLRYDTWADKQTGAKRSRLTIVLASFQFVGGREDTPGGAASSPAPTTPPTTRENPDEDVPF